MSDGLFSTVELGSATRAGFRLHHVEVFNWGTFDKRVWRLGARGETALLTGDIGSGKSTLVDAVTTLLLPAHRIYYNKAAGADVKERTLRSYVEGHFKSERIEATGASRAIGLRDHRTYSVVLGVFANEGYDETVSLAQVFHQKERAGQPDRFFVASDKALSIEADFTAFGSDLNDLRKRLRAGGAEIHNVFPDYSRSARRRLGIKSEQAMDLFHQTVSMKSVGNLNEFVRSHMLEPVDASDKVRGIVAHFEDLTKAHDAVKRARDQLEALAPLVTTADKYDAALQRREEAERQRDAVRLFFAELRIRLLTDEIAQHAVRRSQRHHDATDTDRLRQQFGQTRDALVEERARAGGDRVSELERAASAARQQATERRAKRAGFDDRVRLAGLGAVTDASAFASLATRLARVRTELESREQERRLRLAVVIGELNDLERDSAATRAELESLARRTNNLPSSQLDIRAQLCSDLAVDEGELPFAGELVDVATELHVWRGAAERVLRGFALSLLVPHQHYERVAAWVNERRLTHRRNDGKVAGTRLVYERVSDRRATPAPASGRGLILADCLVVKGGPFESYLRNELVRRADHRCADTLAEFRSERRAVTPEGQVRSGDRHEKDDRSRIDDPRNWVLGWMNERKVAALTKHLVEQQRQWDQATRRRTDVDEEIKQSSSRLTALANLEVYSSWTELDHDEATARADEADAERARLVAGSSALIEIERRLTETNNRISELTERLTQLNGDVRVLDERIERSTQARASDEAFLAGQDEADVLAAQASYADLQDRMGDALPRNADECRPAADKMTVDLQAMIDRLSRELGGYTQSLLQYMNEIRRRWPEATTEMDASVQARAEFRAFHERVAQDDLPRFEADFKEQLNTNTIRELAGFNNWLTRQAGEIHARVDRINEAMGAIDYNPGSYIRLEKERTVNQEIQSFRQDLRNATNDTLAPDDDQYSERRFLEVQRIIERFRGREGHAEGDKTWARRVTDVRNWFTFSASERDRETERGVGALPRLRRQVRRAEGEARLHDPRRVAGLPVRAGVGRDAFPRLPVRRHRRGLRAGLGCIHSLCARALRQTRPAAAHRDAAAEGPCHRAVRPGDRIRRQPVGEVLPTADAHNRGVPPPAGQPLVTWTTVADIREKVRLRWNDGSLLRSYAAAESFPRIEVPLRRPRPAEIGDRLGDAQAWVAALINGGRRDSRYTLIFATVGGRLIGRNNLPSRAIVESYDQAWALLGVAPEVAAYDEVLATTTDESVIRAWVGQHPLKAISLHHEWQRLAAAYRWLDDHRGSGRYLREITAPGVDTKFTERHRSVLGQLLDVPTSPSGFLAGLGLRTKPEFTRLRLHPALGVLPPASELALRHDELPRLDLHVDRALVVENEITYLSVPIPPDGVVVWGRGFDVDRAGALRWLRDADVTYWGDLDTHGFAILNRLRAWLPQARSVLMDRETLLTHQDRWVSEETPTSARLDRLTPDESAVYADLVEDHLGVKVRLEQERIAWAWAEPRVRFS